MASLSHSSRGTHTNIVRLAKVPTRKRRRKVSRSCGQFNFVLSFLDAEEEPLVEEVEEVIL